jgi:hypothetical protein
LELTVDPIQWAGHSRVAHRGMHDLASFDTLQALAFHESLDRAASHMVTFTVQLPPDFVSAVDLHIGLPNPFNFRIQYVITPGASATQCRIPLLCDIASIA